MGTERFNRQFILIDFEDLNNPEFMEFVRSPEFSTYLLLRRYIWRSVERKHRLGLHEYYARGHLAASLSRERIAKALGDISLRQVSRDIKSLVQRELIKPVRTGRGNIFLLGKWNRDEENDVYYEYYYLDRLQVRPDNNVTSDLTSQNPTRQERQVRPDNNVKSDGTDLSHINRESNKERKNKERKGNSNSNNPPSDFYSSYISTVIETCSRDFRDLEHLDSNIARAHNLWDKTSLYEDQFVEKIQEARRKTKESISRSAIRDRNKKMAYFFAILEDLLGLKKES